MRIDCPHCGPRDIGEFTCLGDAAPRRPQRPAGEAASADVDAFAEYVFIRDNIAGPTAELWYHGLGCRAWLEVVRDTTTHDVLSVSACAGADR